MDQTMGVRTVKASPQAVKYHQPWFVLCQMRIFAPRQVNKIAVRQFEALPLRRKLQAAA